MLNIPEQGVVQTPGGFHWIDNGIIFSVSKDKNFLDIEEARNITKAFQKLTNKPLPLFVDLNTTSGQSSETRNYFANDALHLETYSAVALFVSNPVAKVVANIYMGLVKPQKPTKLFTDYNNAIEWLDSYKQA